PQPSVLVHVATEFYRQIIDPSGLTPGDSEVRILAGGQPSLRPDVAYGYNYGAVWTPKFIRGLTLSADFYHIDLRDRTNSIDPEFIVIQNFESGGRSFSGHVVRDSSGAIVLVRDLTQKFPRTITDGIE